MTDTLRTQAELLVLFADNSSGQISAQDGRDFIVSSVLVGDDVTLPAAIELPTAVGATITGGICPITQSFHEVFPAPTVFSSATSTTATTLVDTLTTMGAYTGYFIAATASGGPRYATVTSVTAPNTLNLSAGWIDDAGAAATTPTSTTTYSVTAAATNLNTFSQGAGNQLLVVTMADLLPPYTPTVVIKHAVDNIYMSGLADLTINKLKYAEFYRRQDAATYQWVATL